MIETEREIERKEVVKDYDLGRLKQRKEEEENVRREKGKQRKDIEK